MQEELQNKMRDSQDKIPTSNKAVGASQISSIEDKSESKRVSVMSDDESIQEIKI